MEHGLKAATMDELLPQGAEIVEGGVRYRIWAPDKQEVEVEVTNSFTGRRKIVKLLPEEEGYHAVFDQFGVAGDTYQYRFGGEAVFPDPASRWQPEGVHGRSLIVDPRKYEWKDAGWERPRFRDLVLYELHIGTFTGEGTFSSAIARLPYIRSLGVNAIEIMPVADFPGDRNWGYDGVALFAPARCYGHPDDLRALVDAAHALGLAVVLDVVYNHFGPDGNYLNACSPYYFTKSHKTPWGDGFNFDGEHSGPVRAFFISNATYWLREFHIDGLRLDATHALVDDSPKHILEEITDAVHAHGGYVFGEDERNEAKLITRKPKGYGMNAVYADDFCHTIQMALGDLRFVEDFTGSTEELADELTHGWHYRGQESKRRGKPRGTDGNHLAPEHFLFSITNHDQAGNHALGLRLNHITTPECYRAASALLLLAPYTPQIFMGQEWAASTPFQYFTDHKGDLGRAVSEGRRKEFARYKDFKDVKNIPDPQSPDTFLKSKLDWAEPEQPSHAETLALYRECLKLRMGDPVFRPDGRENWKVANLGMLALHYRDGGDWLILADFTGDHHLSLTEEEFSLLRIGKSWNLVFSTNEVRFGGDGRKSFDEESEVVILKQPELLVLKSA